MDSSDDNSDSELFMPAAGGVQDLPDFPVPEHSQLKPKLDSIFAEVEKNLPSIDFDLSDVSSDNEDQEIFHRSLFNTSLFDDDKDLDTSQCGETFSELMRPSVDSLSLANIRLDVETDALETQDNDTVMASAQRPKNQGGKSTSWTEVVIEAHDEKDKFKERKTVASISTMTQCGSQTEDDLPPLAGAFSAMEEELGMEKTAETGSVDEELEKHEKESTSETESKAGSSSGVGIYRSGDKRMNKMVTAEEIRRSEKELVSSIVPASPPRLLSNNLNIDLILCTLDEEHQLNSSVPPVVREAWARQQRIQSLIGAGEGSNRFLDQHKEEENAQPQTLIQRLAEFSMKQSGEDLTDIDPMTGVRATVDKDADVIEMDNKSESPLFTRRKAPPQEQSEKKITSTSCGTNTSNNDGPLRVITPTPKNKLLAEKNPEPKRERETVFIDLRNHDQKVKEQQQSIERVQKVLQITREGSESDSDSEDDMQSWIDQRRRMKQTLTSRGVSADLLPSKPKIASSEPFKHPNRVINLAELDNRFAAKVRPEEAEEELTEEQKTAIEKARRVREEERERQRKIEEARKQREEREAERQSRVRLAKRLEVLRPTASVSGKQDCAETTPVMFDIEASYEPAPSTLLPFLPSEKEVLLLTIHLSSNGEIILHRGKSKSVDTGLGLSASYTVLLTWLLSMVPENYDFLIKKPEDLEQVPFYPPFYVLGLQQLWMDENLCLVVAVTPHPHCNTKAMPNKQKKSKTKLKDEVKNNSPFQQFLAKFLSTNTLHTVCPWLQAVVPIDISCPTQNPEDTSTYIYRAPLPIITTKPLSTFIQMNPDPRAAQKVFNTPVGFFWQTMDNEECSYDHGLNDSEVNYDTQVTMSLVYKKIFQEPPAMSGIFNKIMQEGLDLSGIRLLYPVQELLDKPNVPNQTNRVQSNIEFLNRVGPVLALGLRGTFARAIWLDAVGPTDPALARRTDPNSLCALYGGASRDECLLFTPRNPARVHSELTRWFAGRVPPGGVIDVGTPYTRKDHLRSGSPKGQRSKKNLSNADLVEEKSLPGTGQSKKVSSHHSLTDSHTKPRPPAGLTATTTSEIILVISPVLRPQYIGIIMASCQRKGFRIRGVKRQRLTSKKVAGLGIDTSLLKAFCPGVAAEDVPSAASKHAEAISPCFLLLLEKENAAHNAASLIESCMIQLTLKGLMENMQSTVDHYLESKHMFYSARYSDALLANLGGDFSKCVDHEIQVNPNFVVPKLYTNPEVEQIVILLLLGHEIQKNSGIFVGKLLGMVPYGKLPSVVPLKDGFELLGLKWLSGLTTSQAKEVTPCEVGDRLWKDNIHTLMSEPALVLALRGIDAFRRLGAMIPQAQPGRGKDPHVDYIMSQNAEESYGFARAFFTDKEIFSDPSARHLLMYLPQIRHHIQGFGSRSHSIKTDVKTESMFDVMLSGPQPITTLLVIKPRAVKKHLTKVLRKIMLEGFRVVGLRQAVVQREEELLCLVDEEGELDADRVDQHKKYLSSGPLLILALERENSVKKLLDLLGPCDPLNARRQSQFLWRGTFGMDAVVNGLHGSKNFPHAVQELRMFFKDGLCCNDTEELRDLGITGPAVDSLMDTSSGDKRIVQVSDMRGDTAHSAIEIQLLLQTTCVVLKPPLLKIHDRGHYAYVDIVEEILKQEFEIVGARMVWFTQEQAEVFLHIINAGSYKQVPMLLSGPSLVFALQRDNAVLSFDSILGSDFGADSIIGKYGGGIFRPTDIKQAHRMLEFFFDELMPGSQIQIIPKEESHTE